MRPPQRSSLLVPAVTLMVIVLGTGAAMAAALAAPSAGKTKAPKLKPVPKVVKVKSTRKPPKNVRFRGQPMPGGITTGSGTATGGAGEVIIPGVPGYAWRDGCGPTALGMVIGYYDGRGWSDLIPGDATSQTTEVSQAIATHGTVDAPGHYEDYSLPMDASTTTVLADSSEAPAGDEHVANSIADFMQTSWSTTGLRYGWSWSNMMSPAFTRYTGLRCADATATSAIYSNAGLTWGLVKQEIDAGRPMVLLVDSSGDSRTDHFVTAVGYREINGYPEYACWDTWSTTLLRWQQFREMSSSYAWGVWGAYTFSLSATEPTPDPTPSATAAPTPTPPPAPVPTIPALVDTAAPVTTAIGVDDGWHNVSVTVTFSASDAASGVAYTEYSLDGGAWTRAASVTVAVSRKVSTAVVHTLQYRSADNAGNLEATRLAQVKIDSVKPVTTVANPVGTAQPSPFTLLLTPRDADSGVEATYFKLDGAAYKAGTSVVITGAGRHTVRYYSVDRAGNIEAAKSVTVRSG